MLIHDKTSVSELAVQEISQFDKGHAQRITATVLLAGQTWSRSRSKASLPRISPMCHITENLSGRNVTENGRNKMSLFGGDMSVYVENPRESTKQNHPPEAQRA